MKDWLRQTLSVAAAIGIVSVGLFVVHVLVLMPARLYQEALSDADKVRSNPQVIFSEKALAASGYARFGVEIVASSNIEQRPFSIRIRTNVPVKDCTVRVINVFEDPREYGPAIPEGMNGCDKHLLAGIRPAAPWVISLYSDEPMSVIGKDIIPPPY